MPVQELPRRGYDAQHIIVYNQNINLHCLQDGRWLSPDDKPPPDLVINQPASTASKSSLLQVSFGMNWTIQACFTSSFVSFWYSVSLHFYIFCIWFGSQLRLRFRLPNWKARGSERKPSNLRAVDPIAFNYYYAQVIQKAKHRTTRGEMVSFNYPPASSDMVTSQPPSHLSDSGWIADTTYFHEDIMDTHNIDE